MSTLQKVNLGTPPTAVDGDTARGANTKANANVDVLNAQTILTSNAAVITAAQALTVAQVGKRVNINLAVAGTINLPAASTCAADNVIQLRNLGATLVTLAITAGSGDTIALTTLAAGESAIMDTDGVHAWTCAMRGRSNSANEVVQGNCSVLGNETVGGTLAVTGATTLTSAVRANAGVTIQSGVTVLKPDNVTASFTADSSGNVGMTGNLSVAGTATLNGPVSMAVAPTYPSTTVARNAFRAGAAGKAMVSVSTGRVDFAANTQTVYTPGAAGIDAVGSWNGSNTFTAPSAGVYKVTFRSAWASGYSATDYVDILLNSTGAATVGHARCYAPPNVSNAYWTFGLDRYVNLAAGAILYISLTFSLGMYISPDGGFNMLAIEQIS